MTGSQPRLDWPRFELVGGLVIFLGQLQKRVDRPIVIEAERDAAAMFGLLPKPGYLLVYHPPTGTKQGKISIASALDPHSKSKAPAGDGRSAGERLRRTAKYRPVVLPGEWGSFPIMDGLITEAKAG